MKFSCEKDVILKEIAVAHEIIVTRNAISILSNVLLEADGDTLTIRASDLKVAFETRIPVLIEIPGTTTVFCDKLLNILRTLPEGEVVFEQAEQDRINITSGQNISFQLHSIAADKFPEITTTDEKSYFEIAQTDFIEMISLTIFAVSFDETRYFMNGVYLEKDRDNLVMVATDGRRLSYISKKMEEDIPDFKGIIIPPKVLNIIRKQASGEGSLKIANEDKTFFVRFDNQAVTSSLIDGQFPNYEKVIPKNLEHEITVNRSELLNALKRVSLLADKTSKRVQIEIIENTMKLQSMESEIGVAKESIGCQADIGEAEFCVNFVYIADPLKVIEEKEVKLKFADTKKAIMLTTSPETTHYHIIMPIQKG